MGVDIIQAATGSDNQLITSTPHQRLIPGMHSPGLAASEMGQWAQKHCCCGPLAGIKCPIIPLKSLYFLHWCELVLAKLTAYH